MPATYVPGPHGPMVLSSAAVGGGDSTATTNFLARTSGLDATHTNAYKALLNGLTTDGLFNSDGTTNFFDCLYIWATQNQTTALLNLVSSSFACLNASSLTFTADSGFTADSNSLHFIDTQFDATTATSPKFVQNSAHVSVWNLTNVAEAKRVVAASASALGTNLFPKYSDNNVYARLNDNPESGAFAITDPRGHLLMNRSSSTGRELYQNASTTLSGGVAATYGSTSSQAPNSGSMQFLADGTRTLAGASIGLSMNSTQTTNFYNRLRTYMTAVGVP